MITTAKIINLCSIKCDSLLKSQDWGDLKADDDDDNNNNNKKDNDNNKNKENNNDKFRYFGVILVKLTNFVIFGKFGNFANFMVI